jgi:hypothetical protein
MSKEIHGKIIDFDIPVVPASNQPESRLKGRGVLCVEDGEIFIRLLSPVDDQGWVARRQGLDIPLSPEGVAAIELAPDGTLVLGSPEGDSELQVKGS